MAEESKPKLPDGAKLLDDKKHFHLANERYSGKKDEKPKTKPKSS